MPPPPRKTDAPLSSWQKFLKRTGAVLSENGVELAPGNRDVRLLAVFCSLLYNHFRGWHEYGLGELSDELLLKLARSYHEKGGRAALSDYNALVAWIAEASA